MTHSLFEQGIGAALAGRRDAARELLTQVVEADDHNEEAWVWLAGTVDDPQDMRICLENALQLNPSNLKAQQGLAWVEQRYGARAPEESAPLPALSAPAPQPAPERRGDRCAVGQPGAAARAPRRRLLNLVLPPASPFYRSLHEHPVGSAAHQYTEAPCVYCGAAMLLSQKRCPKCHASQMFRAPADPHRGAKAMTLLSWCWLLPAVLGFAAFIFSVFVGFVEGLSRRSPGLLGIIIVIVMVIVFTIVYLLLWSPFLLLARGLYRCRRWAYIIQSVWTAIELAVCVIAALFITRMPGGVGALLSDPAIRQQSIFLSSPTMFWGVIASSIGWRLFVCLLLWFGYGAVFSRRSRLVPAVNGIEREL